MSTLHIIGIGGTGHKLITAAIHMAACGAFKGKLGTNEIGSIRIITIDADSANGNLQEAMDAVESYNKFYNVLGQSKSLDLVKIETLSSARPSILLYENNKKSIFEAFNITRHRDSDTDKFIRFLYTKDEIEVKFDQGFYGHTSIGTLIVNNILKQNTEWKSFLGGISNDDFIFVAGSIFGGTGASAIPVVLEELKAKQKKDSMSYKYAALFLAPYFKTDGTIQGNSVLKPDSKNFQVKAKASLYYYLKQHQYENADAIYVIGEPQENFSVETASIGAVSQHNKAHMIELFAVSAMVDFIKHQDGRIKKHGTKIKQNNIITAERQKIKNGEYCYTWDMLKKIDTNLPAKIQKLIKAAIFYNKALYGELKTENPASEWIDNFKIDLIFKTDDDGDYEYENIHSYFTKLISWFYDLHKKNLEEINQKTGSLKWQDDERAKLLNAKHGSLFNDEPVKGNDIKDFEALIYNDENPRKSIRLYNDIADSKGDGFRGLFDALASAINNKKRGLFDSKLKIISEVFDIIPYYSEVGSQDGLKGGAGENKLWIDAPPDLLLYIADGLPFVSGDEFKKDEISIPSPWSIFIINELTLTEDKFEGLNKTAYNQWCGLLALLALRDLCHYNGDGLKLETLKLDAAGDFVKATGDTCLPYSSIFNNPQWTVCNNISLDTPQGVQTIGFLAANTIVCPAYSFSAETKTKLYQMAPGIIDENGKFLNPENYFSDQSQAVNQDAKCALHLFLEELKKIITAQAAVNTKSIIGSLQKLIEKFINDLGNTTSNPAISIQPPSAQPTDIYDLFDKLCIKSNVVVPKPFRLVGTKKNAVLIGLNIRGISSSSPAAAAMFITNKLKYSQINQSNVDTFVTDDGYELLYDETLLCDEMVAIKKDGGGRIFNSSADEISIPGYEIIWPINEKLLDLYDIDKINNMLSVSSDAVAITVSLTIDLDSGKHTISKKYKLVPDANTTDNGGMPTCVFFDREHLPLWAVWPYSEILDADDKNTWKRYNYFCVQPKFTGSFKVLEITPVFKDIDDSKTFSSQKLSTITTDKKHKYYKRSKTLPVALKFNLKSNANSPAVYSGVVILERPKKVRREAVEWNIGLDFGTTSTTAFYATKNDPSPKFLQLITEYSWTPGDSVPTPAKKIDSQISVLSDSGGPDKRELDLYFIDKQCLKQNGYITAYEIMDNTNQSKDNTIFETGRVFWHNTDNFGILNTKEGRRDNLRTNIKWDGDRANLGKFLNQLLTQMVYTAAENHVKKINWFFSYPTAFGPEARGEFINILKKITELLEKETGIEIIFDDNHIFTESIAAAYYFKSKNKFQQLFLCVDIGGGTSDISIWVKDENIYQSSVRIASRDMFITPLHKLLSRSSIMSEVCDGNKKDDGIYNMINYGEVAISAPEKIQFFIETVLFEYYDTFRNRLNLLTSLEDKECFKNFKYSVLIAYSGLCYYLANIVGSLFETGKINGDIVDIVFGLSGKGSKLTDWISTFCPYIYEEVQALISARKQKYKEITIKQQFDPSSAKTETAKGLICNLDGASTQNSIGASAKPEVYLGSEIKLTNANDTRTYDKDKFVLIYEEELIKTPEKLTATIDEELKDFENFLHFFNKIAAKTQGDMGEISTEKGSWYDKRRISLWGKIKTEFARILTEEKRFDPPFLVMLKVFLAFYSEEYLYANK